MNIHTIIRSTDDIRAAVIVDRVSVQIGAYGEDLWIMMPVEKAAELRDAITTAIARAMVNDATA